MKLANVTRMSLFIVILFAFVPVAFAATNCPVQNGQNGFNLYPWVGCQNGALTLYNPVFQNHGNVVISERDMSTQPAAQLGHEGIYFPSMLQVASPVSATTPSEIDLAIFVEAKVAAGSPNMITGVEINSNSRVWRDASVAVSLISCPGTIFGRPQCNNDMGNISTETSPGGYVSVKFKSPVSAVDLWVRVHLSSGVSGWGSAMLDGFTLGILNSPMSSAPPFVGPVPTPAH